MAAPTELRHEEADHVGIVTLGRPEARNALTFATYAEGPSIPIGGGGRLPREAGAPLRRPLSRWVAGQVTGTT